MAQTSSTDLEVVSMVIWLSTGNGKFFELVRGKTILYSNRSRFFSSSSFSMVLVIQSNKFYLNHRRQHFVGVITIHPLILIDNPILKFWKLFSRLVSVSRVHQALVPKVFCVRNTFSSNALLDVFFSSCSLSGSSITFI